MFTISGPEIMFCGDVPLRLAIPEQRPVVGILVVNDSLLPIYVGLPNDTYDKINEKGCNHYKVTSGQIVIHSQY